MKAIVLNEYGSPDVIELKEVDKPVIKENEVLVRVEAASINAGDLFSMRGSPWLARFSVGFPKPRDYVLGWDMAGRIEAVGEGVTHFQPGDEVYASCSGAFAEYAAVAEEKLANKPATLSFEQAAAVPTAAITALQGLRDAGNVQPGQKVLINGASGGVGTFAVQIAKALGAEVTGVCSTRNVDMVRSLGADHVIDYKKESYTESGEKYDVIIDMVSNHPLLANRDVLTPDGVLVIVGGAKGNWVGPLAGPIKAGMLSPFVGQELIVLMARMRQEDLATLADLMRKGAVQPVIDRRFSLGEVPEAIRYSETGRARGKIIIDMNRK